MTARLLDAHSISTVIIGSALDILKHCGAPRYLFNDLPLGNPLGNPYKPEEHLLSVRQALRLVEDSESPTGLINNELHWEGDNTWRENYMRVDDANREELKLAGIENRRLRLQQNADLKKI
ncbi:MAG: D-proline reductase (dithiol) PrdB [Flavobacterium sp.]